MNHYKIIFVLTTLLALGACKSKFKSDASGMFEAEEVIVSSEQNGRILSFNINEGDVLKEGSVLGHIDVSSEKLKAEQVESSIQALQQKTMDPSAQIAFYQKQMEAQATQLRQLEKEKKRIENLLQADAATPKQLDDIKNSIEQVQKQMEVTHNQMDMNVNATNTQNRGIISEQEPLRKSAAQIGNQINKGDIVSPITGTVLTKYAYNGEMAMMGKPLFKIAKMDTMTLRAYVTGDQLGQIKNGQTVTVLIDQGKDEFKNYNGTISWISSKAEFTPKTIQTKDERANLVYAVKIRVKNDGYLKIGMYGEVRFK